MKYWMGAAELETGAEPEETGAAEEGAAEEGAAEEAGAEEAGAEEAGAEEAAPEEAWEEPSAKTRAAARAKTTKVLNIFVVKT